MILEANVTDDYRSYTILDAHTGRCLDQEYIFYVDSDRGFYRRYLVDSLNRAYFWDRRTKQPAKEDTPDKFKEVAWETVRRPVAIFKKGLPSDEEEAAARQPA
jgi:hypothetical protein